MYKIEFTNSWTGRATLYKVVCCDTYSGAKVKAIEWLGLLFTSAFVTLAALLNLRHVVYLGDFVVGEIKITQL